MEIFPRRGGEDIFFILLEDDTVEPRQMFSNLAADKKERIITAALEEFSEHGYQKTSINTIVRRLGIAKGSIFHYFGDKQGLFFFVFTISLEKVKDFLRGVRDATAEDPVIDRIEKTLRAGVRFINAHPLLYRMYIRVLFEARFPQREKVLLAIRRASHDFLRELILAARERGEVREDLDPEAAAFVLDAVLDRFLQAQSIEHLDGGMGLYGIGEPAAQDWIRRIVNVYRTGIAA